MKPALEAAFLSLYDIIRAMKSVFEVADGLGVGRWAFQGQVTDEFFQQSFDALSTVLEDVQLNAGIIDFVDVTSFDVSENTLKQLASTHPIMPREMLRVVIAPNSEVFAKARLFAVLSELSRPNFFVVRSREAAYHILGVTSPNFRPLRSVRSAS